MDTIFFDSNKYILLKDIPDNRKCDIENDPRFILPSQGIFQGYNGRLKMEQISMSTVCLIVNNFKVLRFDNDRGRISLHDVLSIELAVAYLNQIHVHGIEKFLASYKKALEYMLKETNKVETRMADNEINTLTECIMSMSGKFVTQKSANYFEKACRSPQVFNDYFVELANW